MIKTRNELQIRLKYFNLGNNWILEFMKMTHTSRISIPINKKGPNWKLKRTKIKTKKDQTVKQKNNFFFLNPDTLPRSLRHSLSLTRLPHRRATPPPHLHPCGRRPPPPAAAHHPSPLSLSASLSSLSQALSSHHLVCHLLSPQPRRGSNRGIAAPRRAPWSSHRAGSELEAEFETSAGFSKL